MAGNRFYRPALVLAIVALTAGIFAGTAGSPASVGRYATSPFGTALSGQTCGKLESSASLNAQLTDLYAELEGPYGPFGPEGAPTVGLGAYPNLTVGQLALVASWTYICESRQFGFAYAQLNGTNGYLLAGTEVGGNGHLQFIFGVVWYTPTSPPRCFDCRFLEHSSTWFLDLVTYEITGPTYTVLGWTAFEVASSHAPAVGAAQISSRSVR